MYCIYIEYMLNASNISEWMKKQTEENQYESKKRKFRFPDNKKNDEQRESS